MKSINYNFEKIVGTIKPMHGVGQPPLLGTNTEKFKYLQEANIPYSRLHDVGGWFGGNLFVDINNIFRDFDADENDPASYSFNFTDIIIKALIENNCEPYFRLGVTIENFHNIQYFRISPPKDIAKWARICEHIVRHYNEGWADGFYFNIKYWEIWNEPDGSHLVEENAMWKGTREEYFEMYRVTSKHLRSCFGDSIKIGGYASCGFYAVFNDKTSGAAAMGSTHSLTPWEERIFGFVDFFEAFMKMVTAEKLPFDFFSFHSYASVTETKKMIDYVEEYFKNMCISGVEFHLNEWNTNPRLEERGKSKSSADTTALMCCMQNTPMSVMCYYDARIGTSVYGGLFNPMDHKPVCTYYGFKAFGKLYTMKNQVEVTGADDGIYSIAAADNSKKGIIISNIGDDVEIETNIPENMKAYLIDEEHFLEEISINPQKFTCKANAVIYFEG